MSTNTEWAAPLVLRAAALLIESRQPASQALLTYRIPSTPDRAQYLVRFTFPGVVSVYAHDTGELIVRSLPGRPTEPNVPRVKRARGVTP